MQTTINTIEQGVQKNDYTNEIVRLLDGELTTHETLQLLFNQVKDLATSKQGMIDDPEGKEVLLEGLAAFDQINDVSEQAINVLCMYTVMFEHVWQYAKIMENFVPKQIKKIIRKKLK